MLLFWLPRPVVPDLRPRFVTGYPGPVRLARRGRWFSHSQTEKEDS